MQYIVFDLEFNQDFSSYQSFNEKTSQYSQYPIEIIQIGAIKIDINHKTTSTFNRYIKPTLYSQISTIVTDLTGITTDQLLLEETFPEVFKDFINFIGEDNTVFCIWGTSDMKVLFKNVEYHKLDKKRLSVMYINLQPYVSTHFGLSQSKLLSLQTAVESLHIIKPYEFHNALYDAYYTAEIFKRISNPTIHPNQYDPIFINIRPRQPKKIIDFEKLLLQFEKMYSRELTKEEQDMIKISYLMGKTHQFIK